MPFRGLRKILPAKVANGAWKNCSTPVYFTKTSSHTHNPFSPFAFGRYLLVLGAFFDENGSAATGPGVYRNERLAAEFSFLNTGGF